MTRGYSRYILSSMPKVTVYIRKEDYPKWVAVKKKTAFISAALSGEAMPPIVEKRIVEEEYIMPLVKKALETPNPVKKMDYDEWEGSMFSKPIKTPAQAKKALKPLTEGHKTYFKKSSQKFKQPTDDFQDYLEKKKKT